MLYRIDLYDPDTMRPVGTVTHLQDGASLESCIAFMVGWMASWRDTGMKQVTIPVPVIVPCEE